MVYSVLRWFTLALFFVLSSAEAQACKVNLVMSINDGDYKSNFCRGAFVGSRLVVTAGHCLWHMEAMSLLHSDSKFYIEVEGGEGFSIDSWSLSQPKDLGWIFTEKNTSDFFETASLTGVSGFFKMKGPREHGDSGEPILQDGRVIGVVSQNDARSDSVLISVL